MERDAHIDVQASAPTPRRAARVLNIQQGAQGGLDDADSGYEGSDTSSITTTLRSSVLNYPQVFVHPKNRNVLIPVQMMRQVIRIPECGA
ncbi:hypothetical protein CLCR_11058 [Cladophialophora carrionii]|uniref:Uncharacterized protein n=1 Tax=Cladophialophora carrionii TaxID=86049 RepID=A0A1C1CYW1_9EURO|nr:hypothetical protein CLCR_11058 [Cladophialophora carrionii]